jgi:hypothetical protein
MLRRLGFGQDFVVVYSQNNYIHVPHYQGCYHENVNGQYQIINVNLKNDYLKIK